MSENKKISKSYWSEIRVIYADTDQMGIVYYAKYLEYFEISRNEALRQVGSDYKSLENNNICFPVTEAYVNYYKSAKYDDLLSLECVIEQPIGRSLQLQMNTRIYCNKELLVEGYTKHILVNLQGRPYKPTGQSKEVYDSLREVLFTP